MNEITTEAFSIICRNEDVFEFTQEHGLHGVIICNTENSEENWFNPKFFHSLGYENDQESLNWEKTVSAADAGKVKRILDSNNYSGETLSGTIQFTHSNGFLIPMDYRSMLVVRETGSEPKVVVAVKKAVDHAHIKYNPSLYFQTEQLLETVLETIDVGVVAINTHGEITTFNKAAREWHDLPLDKLSIDEFPNYFQLCEADGVTPFNPKDLIFGIIKDDIVVKDEFVIKPLNKKKKTVRQKVTGTRLYDERKNVIGAVLAMYNITDRKQIENRLTISEQMFRGTFENAADGMAISDASGKFTEINDSLCKMLGYSSDELKELNFLDITHPDDVQDDLKRVKELLNSERDYIHKEKRFIYKNGGNVHVILSVSLVRDHNSDPLYMIAQMTDISKLKSAQKEIASILRITTDQNQRLINFAHIVSHNLRSHSGNFEMLLDIFTDEHPEQKDNEVVAMLNTASGNLKETIAHLNEVALINTSVSNEMLPINLKDSVIKTLGSINALVQKSNIQIINDIPEELEVISLPAYLESIILNFATNAIKYRSAKRRPMLRFEAVKVNDHIELRIEDNGIGIDLNKYGAKLFGMYKTFHQHEDARGIGLFITKNQIEAIGGKVEVESQVDKGTTFTIFFKHGKN